MPGQCSDQRLPSRIPPSPSLVQQGLEIIQHQQQAVAFEYPGELRQEIRQFGEGTDLVDHRDTEVAELAFQPLGEIR